MKRSVLARVVLTLIGVAVWGYGYRYDQPETRLAAIGILAVALVLRFVPGRYFGDPGAPPAP